MYIIVSDVTAARSSTYDPRTVAPVHVRVDWQRLSVWTDVTDRQTPHRTHSSPTRRFNLSSSIKSRGDGANCMSG